jgi:hypothetical protein
MVFKSLVDQMNQIYIHSGITTILLTVTEIIQPFWPGLKETKLFDRVCQERPPPVKIGQSGGKM